MKKLLACLLLCSITISCWASGEIKYIDKVRPEYREAAYHFRFDYTSDAKIEQENKKYAAAMAKDVEQEKVVAKLPDYDMPLYIYRPKAALSREKQLPVVYYSHGGGFLSRRALYNRQRFQNIADNLDMIVATPRYRLATEAAFPAQLTDAYGGLLYLKENGKSLGINPQKIVLMGDSAGGWLSASMSLYNRDHENIKILGQVLLYPMLDMRTGGPASPYNAPYTGYVCWSREANTYAVQKLQGGKAVSDKMLPYFSPAQADNLQNLPPAFIYTGDLDLFVNENLDYANKLISAGVMTEIHVVPGLYHAFEAANSDAQPSKDFWQAVYRFTKDIAKE